jgi:hypothetical protein
MRPAVECPFEPAVLAAVAGGRLHASTDDVERHVQQCAMCSELAEVAVMLRDDHEKIVRSARVPAAGQVWWRAVVRARLEAAHAASRPITWLQGGTGACVVGVVCAVIAFAWPSIRETLRLATRLTIGVDPGTMEAATSFFRTMTGSLPLMLGIAVCIILAPIVALCLALSDRGD